MIMQPIMEGWRDYLKEEIVTEATLSFSQLAKSQQRMARFIEKLENGEPFDAVDGSQVTFERDEEIIAALKKMLSSGEISAAVARQMLGRNFALRTTDGRTLPIGKLLKTAEFGGKGTDFYVKKEIAARGQLSDLISKALAAANTDAIIIKVLNSSGKEVARYDDIIGIEDTVKVGGVDPKSDFQLIRKDGKPPVYISHKDGTSAKSFGQWSGLSIKAGEKIYNHPEVKSFIADLEPHLQIAPDGRKLYPPGLSIGRFISDRALQYMSIFGQDYSPTGPGSPNNCDLVAQGLFTLETEGAEATKDDNEPEVAYTLSAHHMMARLDSAIDFDESYKPALVTRYARRRNNFGIKGLRATIYPAGGRKVHQWI